MDFWSDSVKAGFDQMFDLNGDGKMDFGETVMQYEYMGQPTNHQEPEQKEETIPEEGAEQ